MNLKVLMVPVFAGIILSQASTPDNDRLSPEVRNFVNKSKEKVLSKQTTRKAVLKSDLLGRKNKNTNQEVSYITGANTETDVEETMEVVVHDLTIEDVDIEPISASMEINSNNGVETFTWNGEKTNKQKYFQMHDAWDKKRVQKKKPLKASQKLHLTAAEIEDKLSTSENIYIREESEIETDNSASIYVQYPWIDGKQYTSHAATVSEQKELNHLNNALSKGYQGQDIGVHVTDNGCANIQMLTYPGNYTAKACNRKNQEHATWMTDLVSLFAPKAKIFGYDQQNVASTFGPTYPEKVTPRIYIGSISVGKGDDKNPLNKSYNVYDAALDNYIYNTGVTEFVAAGNFFNNKTQSAPFIQAPAKAQNAITVGAVDPVMTRNSYNTQGFNYEVYSNSINSSAGDHKPEILNTGFIYKPGQEKQQFGTSISAPITAALAADLMTQHPFYKGHPEMVKAVFLTSSWANALRTQDTDGGATKCMPSYRYMAELSRYSGYVKNYTDAQLFQNSDGSSKIYTIKLSNVKANEHYRFALAWLAKGSTIKKIGRTPLLLTVYPANYDEIYPGISNGNNPYVVYDFKVEKDGDMFFYVVREANFAPEDKITMGFHTVKLPN